MNDGTGPAVPRKTLPRPDLSSDNVAAVADQLPHSYYVRVAELRERADMLAWHANELARDYRDALTTLGVLIGETNYWDGMDLTLAVSRRSGLEDAWFTLHDIGEWAADEYAHGDALRRRASDVCRRYDYEPALTWQQTVPDGDA